MKPAEFDVIRKIANEYLAIDNIFEVNESNRTDTIKLPQHWIEEALIEAYKAGKGDIQK